MHYNLGKRFLRPEPSGPSVTLEYDDKQRQWKQTVHPNTPTKKVPDVAAPSPTMCRYFGKLRDGKPTGKGILTIKPQSGAYETTYSGGWKDGKYHGTGEMFSLFNSHSRSHVGGFRNGLKHGYGRESWMGGSYAGLYRNGKMFKPPILWRFLAGGHPNDID